MTNPNVYKVGDRIALAGTSPARSGAVIAVFQHKTFQTVGINWDQGGRGWMPAAALGPAPAAGAS